MWKKAVPLNSEHEVDKEHFLKHDRGERRGWRSQPLETHITSTAADVQAIRNASKSERALMMKLMRDSGYF